MMEDNVNRNSKGRARSFVRNFMSGNILRHPQVRSRLPYALFIALLMLLYIMNGYHIQKLHRRHSSLGEEVRELRVRSLSFTGRLMESTRQSEILKELERRGIDLHESVTPPVIIEK